ncbi:MAG: flavodoxin family protein [Candidatus Thorarchaeota archaeon]|jgi:multimeric flavodoxin WrbA
MKGVGQSRGILLKVLALNSSPRKERGSTAGVLTPFLEGVKNAGAEIELVYIRDLDIKPCRGCFTCWTKTPGECIIKDDMKEILPKIDNADIIIYATPVYEDGMTATMKALMDRSIPLDKGTFEIRNDHCRHPRRSKTKDTKVVLLSVSGFTELDNFDPLIAHMKAACKNMDVEFSGAVLRPVAWLVPVLKQQGICVDDVFDAVKQAGQEIVEKGEMSSETLAKISRELMSRDMVVRILNEHSGFQ